MRYWIVVGALLLGGCGKKVPEHKPPKMDFETLMGKDLPAWHLVKSREDQENLAFFKALYEKNLPFLQVPSIAPKIPHVIHVIWIGPKPFPRESVENIRSWMAHHPDWTFKFWTDCERVLPHPQMQRCLIQDMPFLALKKCYEKSDNYGEQSDLLRYEILYREGGLYIDHDVKCLRSFDAICGAYDFIAGMELPFKTSLPSSLLPTNSLIGSRPGHPVLGRCLHWLSAHWDQIDREYPGRDRESMINRVTHRTFLVLGQSVKLLANQEGNCDMIFPALYFNAPSDSLALYSRHLYEGTWFEGEKIFEKTVRERLTKIAKKTNQLVAIILSLFAVNLLGFGVLMAKYRRAVAR